MSKYQVTVCVDHKTLDLIKTLADQEQLSMSAIIRTALRRYTIEKLTYNATKTE